jgi:hypothetical protein
MVHGDVRWRVRETGARIIAYTDMKHFTKKPVDADPRVNRRSQSGARHTRRSGQDNFL